MIASDAAGSTVALTRPTNQARPTARAIPRMIMVAAIAAATWRTARRRSTATRTAATASTKVIHGNHGATESKINRADWASASSALSISTTSLDTLGMRLATVRPLSTRRCLTSSTMTPTSSRTAPSLVRSADPSSRRTASVLWCATRLASAQRSANRGLCTMRVAARRVASSSWFCTRGPSAEMLLFNASASRPSLRSNSASRPSPARSTAIASWVRSSSRTLSITVWVTASTTSAWTAGSLARGATMPTYRSVSSRSLRT